MFLNGSALFAIGNLTNKTFWPLGNDGIRSNGTTSQCILFDFCVSGVVGAVVCAVGVMGNVLSLFILARIDKTTSTFFLLRTLAFLHTFVLLSSFLSSSLPSILYFSLGTSSLRYIPYLQWFLGPVSFMAMTATAWTLILLTIYRYRRICKNTMDTAYFGPRAVKLQVATLIVISIGVDIPMYLERLPESYTEDTMTYVVLEPTSLQSDLYYNMVYKMVVLVILRVIIPILLITILTYFIVRVLLQRHRVRRDSLGKRNEGSESQVVTKVMITMAVSFVLCQLPTAIYPFFYLVMDTSNFTCQTAYSYFTQVADNLALTNSALNFFIYYPFVPTFRAVLGNMLCGCQQGTDERRLSVKSRSLTVSSVVLT